jgi:hypothetical protein
VTDTSAERRLSFWSTINGNSENAYIQVQNDGLTTNTGEMLFATKNQAGTLAERMRITQAGNLLVGTTTNTASSKIMVSATAQLTLGSQRDGTATQTHFGFYNPNGQVGTITTNGSSTAFNTSSDYRLKEAVQPMVGASDRLMALKPVNFAWKVDGSRVDGFIAHEAQEVVPEAVTGSKDAVDKDGKPEYQGIDQSKLLPVVVAALQDSIKRIEALEAEVLALKGSANA